MPKIDFLKFYWSSQEKKKKNTLKKNGNSKDFTINNYFKYKWLNAPIKRHKMAEWIKKQTNKTQLFAVFKKLILFLSTYIKWK